MHVIQYLFFHVGFGVSQVGLGIGFGVGFHGGHNVDDFVVDVHTI